MGNENEKDKVNDEFERSIQNEIEYAKEFMAEGDYQIDGLVLTYNAIHYQNELGNTAHHPRYKMAFKFVGEAKQTTIQSIQWQVSRNGILTPIVNPAAIPIMLASAIPI